MHKASRMKKALILLIAVAAAMIAYGQENEQSDEKILDEKGIGTSVEELTRLIVGDEAEISKLVGDLADESYWTREAATEKLVMIGEPCVPLLMKEVSESPDPEVVERSKKILERIENNFYPETQGLLMASAKVLGKSQDAKAVKPLLALMSHRDYKISIQAARALAAFKDDEAVRRETTKLRETVEKSKKEKKIWETELALEKLYCITRDKDILKELVKLSNFRFPWLKGEIVGGLRVLTLCDKTTCRMGERPKISVRIRNLTNKTIYLVGSLDASEAGRYPRCSFEILDPDGKPVKIRYWR